MAVPPRNIEVISHFITVQKLKVLLGLAGHFTLDETPVAYR